MEKLKVLFSSQLQGIYPACEIESFLRLSVAHICHLPFRQTRFHKDIKITNTQYLVFETIVERLKKSEPIQYILGETEFFGLPFDVSPAVLIPRPETEELVEWIIKDFSNMPSCKILEFGTGSGCIAISLAKNMQGSIVSSVDISSDALQVARENAEKNQVQVSFIQQNMLNLDETVFQSLYDVIVSNPPYVCEKEKLQMQPNVLDFEPHLALFVENENPLIFYDKIAVFAKNKLSKKGALYVEINQTLGEETSALFAQYGFNVELRKDISGNDRMIKAVKR